MKKLLILLLSIGMMGGIQAQTADKKADKIIEQYLKAIGGKKKLNEINEMLQKSTMSMNGQEIETEVLKSKKDRGYMKMKVQGMEMLVYAYQGDKGFSMNQQMGYDDLDSTALAKMKQNSRSFFFNLENYKQYNRKYLGIKEKDGKKYEAVEIELNGQKSIMYFDPETHLLKIIEVTNPDNGMVIETYLEDYKDFDGVKFPTRFEVKANGQLAQTIITKEIILNPTNVEESNFQKPE
jgi:hypothetical protein